MNGPPLCRPEELRKLFLFEHLDQDQLEWLCRHGRVDAFPPGTVYTQGEPATRFYVLLSGTVVLSHRVGPDDVEVTRSSSPGVYGGAPSSISFSTGDKMLALTDAGSDYMTVYRNDKELKKMPVTTGKPGFSTRNGIKVVLEQAQTVFMNSSTVGIAAGSSNAYAMNVYWDTRVTWSGEYVHAAPWSEGSQGVSNVSHGCTGMSTADAEWFYNTFRKGDLVQVINSKGHEMEPFGNGFGDWNLSWSAWQKGSALGKPVQTSAVQSTGGAPSGAQAGLIRPQA